MKIASARVQLLRETKLLKGGRPLHFTNEGEGRDRAGWLALGKIILP